MKGIHFEVDIGLQANLRPGRLPLESDLTHIQARSQGPNAQRSTGFSFLYRFFIPGTIEWKLAGLRTPTKARAIHAKMIGASDGVSSSTKHDCIDLGLRR